MTLSRMTLESFEPADALPPEQSAEYQRGFQTGLMAAQQSEAADIRHSIEGIASTLSDMAFGYAEARIFLLNRIRPLLVQVAESVLPQIAQDTFAAHLVDVLHNDFATLVSEPIRISVNPSVIDTLSGALGDTSNFVVIADSELNSGQAVLKNPDTQIMIDLPALVLALQTALSGLEPLERIQSNG